MRLGRNYSHPVLDLSMTIRAQKHALARLDPELVERDGHSLGVDFDALVGGIEMVKVQRAHVAVVAADTTAPSGLADKRLFHPSASTGHGIGSAALTAVSAPAGDPKLALTVTRTIHHRCRQSGLLGCTSSLGGRPSTTPVRLQSMPDQPMPNGRLAAVDGLGDLGDRRSLFDQRLQLPSGQTAAGGVLLSIYSLETILTCPIRDGLFVTIEPPPDLSQ